MNKTKMRCVVGTIVVIIMCLYGITSILTKTNMGLPVATNYYDGEDFYGMRVFTDDELKGDEEFAENILTGRLTLTDKTPNDKSAYNSDNNYVSSKTTIFILWLLVAVIIGIVFYNMLMSIIETALKRKDIFNEDDNIQYVVLILGVVCVMWFQKYNFSLDGYLGNLHSKQNTARLESYVINYVEDNSLKHILKNGNEETVYKVNQDVILGVIQHKEDFDGKLSIEMDMPFIYVGEDKMYFECVKDGYVLYRR